MAAPTKSSIITNLDAAKVIAANVGVSHGRVRYKSVVHTIPFLNSAIGDTHRLLRFNSGDRIHRIWGFSNGASTAGAADLGLYLAGDGAVIDADLFADAWSHTTAGDIIELRYEASGAAAGAFEVSLGEPLWEVVGRGVGSPLGDPFEQYDLTLTATTATTVANDIIAIEVLYTAGD